MDTVVFKPCKNPFKRILLAETDIGIAVAVFYAYDMADRIVRTLREKGYKFLIEPKTNQLFVIMENKHLEELSKTIGVEVWEKVDEEHTAVRIATSWATREEDVDVLIGQL